jgi:glycosyltransferase involved in cell wall biosynthesis
VLVSIVIRTLNEAYYLEDLLIMIKKQKTEGFSTEVVLVDSGSSDQTVEIAERYDCRITHITKQEFSFGRSLNLGCDFAKGEILIFISGHCVPVDELWLEKLCRPIIDGQVAYTYGRQIGDDDSNFSERRIFAKYFPKTSTIPQEGFFCNNANSAICKKAWAKFKFDEKLTGLEDMALAKELVAANHKIGYVGEASVFHHHKETWATVRRRFEREAIALKTIMPEVRLTKLDIIRYIISSVFLDWRSASRVGKLSSNYYSILRYRIAQYVGSYTGNNSHKNLTQKNKERFFYPSLNESDTENDWFQSHRRTSSYESKQSTSKR